LKPFGNPSQPSKRNPVTHWLSINGKERFKKTVTLDKTHANDNKRTKNTHGCTMNVRTSNEINLDVAT